MLALAAALAGAASASGCARQVHPEGDSEHAHDVSLRPAAGAPDGAASSGPTGGTLEPSTHAAAANAVVHEQSAAVVMPPALPRTAAPPTAAPVATPGGAQTLVPVVPRGGTTPVMVPAQTPAGLPGRGADRDAQTR
jgi:hypothetical protein